MHGSLDNPSETDSSIYRSTGFFALPILIIIVLVGLAMTRSTASNWISQAAQSELVGTDPVPDVTPTQLAQPAMKFQTVKAN
jgi:hypothetical protein